jgi:hypothetical protein
MLDDAQKFQIQHGHKNVIDLDEELEKVRNGVKTEVFDDIDS